MLSHTKLYGSDNVESKAHITQIPVVLSLQPPVAILKMNEVAEELYKINAVKFGSYKLKSGLQSPIYFDFRVIISYPTLLERIADLLWEKCSTLQTDTICGVPYTALPLATLVSVKNRIPMLMRRKEAKDYGTRKLIEGEFKIGQTCLIIEDVVTSGTSVLETARELRNVGLKVTNVVVLLDRNQGGTTNLEKNGITMHSVMKIESLLLALEEAKCIQHPLVEEIISFINENGESVYPSNKRLCTALQQRLQLSKNPVAVNLFQLMISKNSNLCVAADFTSLEKIIKITDTIGSKIVVLKVHADILEDYSDEKIQHLKALAQQHQFLIMEDRKFADIGNTVQLQYHGGIHRISQWADLVTAHPLPGPQMINSLCSGSKPEKKGCVLVLEMSSKNALTTSSYRREATKWALESRENITGFVSQSPLEDDLPDWIQFTPGVSLISKSDGKGQQYTTPTEAVLSKGADILIVGRGLIESADIGTAVEEYRKEGWDALMKRLKV